MSVKKVIASLLLAFPLYTATAPMVLAKADSVVVANDGEVLLVIEKTVLGVSVKAADNKNKPSPQVVPVKTVQLVSPSTPSKVTVQSTKTDNKKVNVVITAQTNPPAGGQKPLTTAPSTTVPAQTTGPATTAQTQTNAAAPRVISTQSVDRVVLEGVDKKPVISITPSSNNQVTIQQDAIQVSTILPISIDSVTHALTTTTTKGETKIILPKGVLERISQERLIKNTSLNQAVNLSQDKKGDVVYSVQQTGKLFGLFAVPPATITVSNTTGTLSAPFYARIFAPFLR